MKYTTLKQTEDGSFYSSIRNDDEQPLIVQMNGVNLSEGTLSGDDDVWFTYTGEDVNKLCDLEQQVLTDIKADPEKWFNRKVRDKTIESSFTKSVSNDGQFQLIKSPGLRVFDKNTKDIFEGEMNGEMLCDILVQLQGITFFKRSFQLVLKLHQVQVSPQVELTVDEVSHDDWTISDYGFAQ